VKQLLQTLTFLMERHF